MLNRKQRLQAGQVIINRFIHPFTPTPTCHITLQTLFIHILRRSTPPGLASHDASWEHT
jgi:hypothetical protein